MSAIRNRRRDFLKAVGGAAASTALPQRVWSANDRIAVGFVGVGVMGSENLKAAMDRPEVAVAAVCDVYQPHLERAGALARRHGHQPRELADFREVLADSSIDAICISTPDHWHPYITVEACKAGKDVYVEKPVCVAVDEGLTMVAAARKYDRIVQGGTWQRSGEHFQKACQMVRGGTLGEITFCRTWIYNNTPKEGIGDPPDGSPPAGLDWDLWLGPAPARPFNPNRFGVFPKKYSHFRHFWDYAGGHLTDSGIHMLDIVQMAFGDRMPQSVGAYGGKFWLTDNSETPDTLQVSYEYPGYIASWEHRSNNTGGQIARLMGATFHGTRGTLYVDRKKFVVTPEPKSALEPTRMDRVTDPHPLHWVNFLECVRSRQRPNSDIENCFRSSAMCILGNLSYRTKMRLDWNDEYHITRQPEVRHLLARPPGGPWELKL